MTEPLALVYLKGLAFVGMLLVIVFGALVFVATVCDPCARDPRATVHQHWSAE